MNLACLFETMVSRFKTPPMMQTAEDRTGHNTLMRWKPLPVVLQRHRPLWRWLRDTWIQGHVRTALMIMSYPCFQDASQVVLSEGDQKIQALPS